MVEKQMQQLIKQIKEWGIERGIDQCDPLLQTTKTEEEITELNSAIIRHAKASKDFLNHYNSDSTVYVNPGCNECQEHNLFCEDMGCEYCKYYAEIKDAIGDIFITLVILDLQIGLNELIDFDINVNRHNASLKNASVFDLSQILASYNGKLQDYIDDLPMRKYLFEELIEILSQVCYRYNLTLKECVEYAYNEIKDRKGKIVDGLWEKMNNKDNCYDIMNPDDIGFREYYSQANKTTTFMCVPWDKLFSKNVGINANLHSTIKHWIDRNPNKLISRMEVKQGITKGHIPFHIITISWEKE